MIELQIKLNPASVDENDPHVPTRLRLREADNRIAADHVYADDLGDGQAVLQISVRATAIDFEVGSSDRHRSQLRGLRELRKKVSDHEGSANAEHGEHHDQWRVHVTRVAHDSHQRDTQRKADTYEGADLELARPKEPNVWCTPKSC
ncbi:MAG: hypothetical protein ACHREM_07780 [Polyangiales bacterium]